MKYAFQTFVFAFSYYPSYLVIFFKKTNYIDLWVLEKEKQFSKIIKVKAMEIPSSKTNEIESDIPELNAHQRKLKIPI